MQELLITNIQRMSFHDGPGMRTTVFLKGCNLRCAWCHNPETQDARAELLFRAQRCVRCGLCVQSCPAGARTMGADGPVRDAARCTLCGCCAESCLTGALAVAGRRVACRELTELVLRDEKIFRTTAGGVTCSGGEPLLQIRALEPLCAQLRAQGVHIAFESALCLPWSTVELCLSCADLLLVDCKMLDAARHRAYTGADNRLILENIRRISSQIDFAIRMPVIGGVNNTEEELAELAAFLKPLSARLREIELLPYHNYGIVKAARVGLEQQSFQPPSEQRMEALRGILSAAGLPVK